LFTKAPPWSPQSWQSFLSPQLPIYHDGAKLADVNSELAQLPALIPLAEIRDLKLEVARAQRGDAFILQLGDCAESLHKANAAVTLQKIAHLRFLASLLTAKFTKPIIIVGRIAGQYAKPRSNDFEEIQNIVLPVYRGDMINSAEPTPLARVAEPQRMLAAYHAAYQILTSINTANLSALAPRIYTSHEALLLHYEQSLTRHDPSTNQWYNASTHFPWIGERTAHPDNAHIEYARGIINPLGIKIGTNCTPAKLVTLLAKLNPDNDVGRIVLIYRFGAQQITQSLPPLLQVIKDQGLNVGWSCDPMHGNTITSSHGKTRCLTDIISEFTKGLTIHAQMGIPLAGIHLEATHEDVYECINSPADSSVKTAWSYTSLLDPRLNQQQSCHVIQLLGNALATINWKSL
jgi:3-deoxy-7-phosphoheptulonate synthase